MSNQNESSFGFKVIIIVCLMVVMILLGVIIGQSNKKQLSPNPSVQTAKNQQLESCINTAHSQYDPAIAGAEALDNNAKKYPQASLDQAIASCHQQYGY